MTKPVIGFIGLGLMEQYKVREPQNQATGRFWTSTRQRWRRLLLAAALKASSAAQLA